MSRWRRRVRGAIGVGLAWGAAWFGAGMVLLLIIGPHAADVPFPLFFGFLGFLAGLTFAAVLGAADGRRSFDQLSLPRFAAWGGVGGLLLAAAMALGLGPASLLVLGPVFAAAGAVCAGGSLALARRARRQDALAAAEHPADAGLSDAEVRELLGGKR